MNDLFDIEVNAQKESLKKSSGAHISSHKLSKAHEKVCDENERKNDGRLKY